MTIEGHRETAPEQQDSPQNGRLLRREFFSGSFRRTMPLPPDVDESGIQAQLANGVLTVVLPRTPGAASSSKKVIQIQ